jgi:hypothetical protein
MLTKQQKSFIKTKVIELGLIDSVYGFYFKNDVVSLYARTIADQL